MTGGAPARQPHWVDETVLACFNDAHADAERRGAAEVTIGHVLVAMTRQSAAAATFGIYGIHPAQLRRIIEASQLAPQRRTTTAPTTSPELRQWLDAAQRIAALHGATVSTARDVLDALIHGYGQVASLEQARSWLAQARSGAASSNARQTTSEPIARRERPTLRYAGHAETARRMASANEQRVETNLNTAGAWTATRGQDVRDQGTGEQDTQAASMDVLAARLDRQDRMLWDIVRHLTGARTGQAFVSTEDGAFTDMARGATPVAGRPPRRSRFRMWSRRRRLSSRPGSAKPTIAMRDVRLVDAADQDTDLEALELAAESSGVKRYYLAPDDEIVCAPSIGPATAARLAPHGLTHVKHLLACDPERLSARLGARHLTASRIAAWKDQARLVCTIPWLRGTHAQLLVGAGYASIEKIMASDRTMVCAAVSEFATTRDGLSILRNGSPPEIDRIMRWIENTQQAEPQRAQVKRVVA